MQCFVQALDSCACKAILGHWSCHAKIDWEGMCTLSRRKLQHACTLLELKNMMLLRPGDQLPILTLN